VPFFWPNVHGWKIACEVEFRMQNSEFRRREARLAFSLIEALIALSITSLAGAVLLLSVQSSLDTTLDAVERTIADGLAQQLLDEILTKRYSGPGESALATTLGPLTNESLSAGRSMYDDVDDYAGYVAQPPKGTFGEELGTGDDSGNARLANFRVRGEFFQNWQVRTLVFYVSANDHTITSATPTNFRAIEVHIEQIAPDGRVTPLATRKRVVTYLPPPTS
jgi:type II secretory pathway pseudopilin PulG